MPVIATNTAANSALRYLNKNSDEVSSITSKLASGSRITKASDDAAGLAIGTRIQSDVTVLSQAATNASQASSILQTADGGLSNIGDILQRMKSLATQSDSGSVTDSERTYINAEFQQLLEEVDSIASGTRYNGKSLLDGDSLYSSAQKIKSDNYTSANAKVTTAGNIDIDYGAGGGTAATISVAVLANDTLAQVAAKINTAANGKVSATVNTNVDGTQSLQLATDDGDSKSTVALNASTTAIFGADTADPVFTAVSQGVDFLVGTSTTDTINLQIDDVDSAALGLTGLDVGTQSGATSALSALDTAIASISQARAEVGATMSRFDFQAQMIASSSENLSAAESAIMDADVASEKSKLSSADVKAQAAIAALTQANQLPQELLSLLKG